MNSEHSQLALKWFKKTNSGNRILVILFGVSILLVLYACLTTAPGWTLGATLAAIFAYALLKLTTHYRRGASLKFTVFAIPLFFALACVPVRYILDAKQLQKRLELAGITEYQTHPKSGWEWGAKLFGDLFDTRLSSVQIHLETLNQEYVAQLPKDDLRNITINDETGSNLLPSELIDWIMACDSKRELSIHLVDPTIEEFTLLSRIKFPFRFDCEASEFNQSQVDLSEVKSLHLMNGQVSKSFASHSPSMDLKSLTLSACNLRDATTVLNLAPTNSLRLFDCAIESNPRYLFEVAAPRLNLSRLQLTHEVDLSSSPECTCKRANTIMLRGTQLSDSELLSIVNFREPLKLLYTESSPLSEQAVSELIRKPYIAHLILGGNWITFAHLEDAKNVTRKFVLQVERTNLRGHEIERIKAILPTNVRFSFR